MREKILSQAQREGSKKEASDIADMTNLLMAVDDKQLRYEEGHLVAALKRLIEKKPELREQLEEGINCPAAFS